MTQLAPQPAPLFPSTPNGLVLVVDDVPANVRLLAGILKVEGFEVASATSGAEALEVIEGQRPDVVLLDVMMPEMDGFEVCARIRANKETAHLPVVMVTALRETTDRVRAIEAGADDFLSKPVDALEVVARVRSLTQAKRDREALERAYADLKRAEHLRDSLGEMLVHDLRTPLTTMLASMDLMTTGQAGELSELQRHVMGLCVRGGQHLLSLINEILDIGKMESGEMRLDFTAVRFSALAQEAWQQVAVQAESNGIWLEQNGLEILPDIEADEDILRRVLINLLGNAVRFSRRQMPILLTGKMEGDDVVISIEDHGPGIDQRDLSRIFEKFGQVETRLEGRRMSTGLGLTFCKLAIEAHGGIIGVDSVLGQGSTFWFRLPCEQRETSKS